MTSSKSAGSSCGGRRPMPPPSMWCVPAGPPESTADSAGSTATRCSAGQLRAQRPGRAEEAARRADVAAERVDRRRPGSCSSSSSPSAAVAVDHVDVVELVGRERAGLRGDLGGAPHHRRDQLGRDALPGWGSARRRRRTPASCGSSPPRTRRRTRSAAGSP